MSDEDPFAEPDDTDKTVIRPNPGGGGPEKLIVALDKAQEQHRWVEFLPLQRAGNGNG